MHQYQVETLEMLSLPEDRPLTTNDKINYFQVLSGQLWNYRFIHRDVYHLVESNEDFKRSILGLQDRSCSKGKRIYQAFVDAGLMKMTPSEIEALIINLWIVLTNWTNFLYMSGHISDNNHLEEKWVWQALRQMVFRRPLFNGESRATYEQLLESLGPSDLLPAYRP